MLSNIGSIPGPERARMAARYISESFAREPAREEGCAVLRQCRTTAVQPPRWQLVPSALARRATLRTGSTTAVTAAR